MKTPELDLRDVVPGPGASVKKYFARISAGPVIPLPDGVEVPMANFVTVSNPDALTVALSPLGITVPANGWMDLTFSIEVETTAGSAVIYLVLNINGVWTETIMSAPITTANNAVSGNIKIPVNAGEVIGLTAYMEGASGDIVRSTDACRITAFFY